jgi:hypothetical protein
MKGRVAALTLSAVVIGSVASTPARVPVRYDVALSFTGISGHSVHTAAECTDPVNPAGYDSLVGTVTGDETPATDEDVVYSGLLRRSTKMDFCELKRGPAPDMPVHCRATLTGSAFMNVEIEVYGEAGRGAWLKATPGSGPVVDSVSGNCDPPEMAAILAAYPGGTPGDAGGGGSPDGQPIVEDTVMFFQGGQARLRVGYYPPDPRDHPWDLRVIRRIP